ncbi:MAG: S-adenosylmethionine decarboxylase [Candidatus Atribacteria bacterium]|nr:S-adenosylmethionine decarboxylase [Candidatus Atribacteria bacterium]
MKIAVEIGTHLVLDGYSESEALLSNPNLVYQFLDTFPGEMGMTKVLPPFVFPHKGEDHLEQEGISGIVIISESHISIHTFPLRKYLSLDIFSCKPFDVEKATEHLVQFFGLTSFSKQVLDRGFEYPKSLGFSLPLLVEERKESLEKMAHT